MQVTEVHSTERVRVLLIRLDPNSDMQLGKHEGCHTVSIPLSNLEDGATYEILRSYLLHHVPPREYYSLSPRSVEAGEVFIQLIWKAS